jgi:23S rRNA (guanine2445-N2)-methyltransferase / 23S rRNA (guanine2069-N7)-methyltransferase
VIANPPYGERLGDRQELAGLYTELGEALRRDYPGWQAAVFTGNPDLAGRLGLRPWRSHRLDNGPIPCQLLRFEIGEQPRLELEPGAGMFANRLRKQVRLLGRWARRERVQCYRVYDADLPDYALAVDLYQGEERWVHVQEYAAPGTVDPARAEARRQAALAVIPEVLGVPASRLSFRLRQRQKGGAQYGKSGAGGRLWEVREGSWVFLANFTDYLDTGLFLDQRQTRQLVHRLAADRHFLNLFCYTGTATVAAASGGARTTTSVDLSNTYLDWGRRNLERNGLAGPRHRFVAADCIAWLRGDREEELRWRRYGLILLDPPTFSNSKRMGTSLDVQRDHVELIQRAAALLSPGGILLFCTNRSRFRMDPAALVGLASEDLTAATIPHDFARRPHIHRCWQLERADGRPDPDRPVPG